MARVAGAIENRSEDGEALRDRRGIGNENLAVEAQVLVPGSVAVTESWSIFRAVLDRTGDARHAWKTILTAMLQDVKIAYY